MPLRQTFESFEYPKRLELPVLKELPPEFEEKEFLGGPKRAWTSIAWAKAQIVAGKDHKMRFMTFCNHCGGWVEGEPHKNELCTPLRGLAGRQGTEYYCPRCAKYLTFSGLMS